MGVLIIEILAGIDISEACKLAADTALAKKQSVEFEFNGVTVLANPGDEAGKLAAFWRQTFDDRARVYHDSAEYKEAEAKRDRELREKQSAHMVESAQSESELRVAKCPYPYTTEQLFEYIESLTERKHDYGTCVYAMSLAAEAAFNFVSHKLGVTGFQASCADLDFIRRTRNMSGPFMLIKAEDCLYPQYDVPGRVTDSIESWKPWLSEEAKGKLAKSPDAHPAVRAHWEKLAEVIS